MLNSLPQSGQKTYKSSMGCQSHQSKRFGQKITRDQSKMIIFYLFFITFSNASFLLPSEPEALLNPENSSLDIMNKHEDSVNVDKNQEELKKQQTVFNKMMSNIQAEMTEMKECLLMRKENIAESISACTAALEESILEAVDRATPRKEDEDVGPPRTLSVNATGEARMWWSCLGYYTLTEEQHRGRPVYRNSKGRYLYTLENGVWAVSGRVGRSLPVYRSTDPAPSPTLCQNWEYEYLDSDDGWKFKPGDITVVDISDPGESQEGHFTNDSLIICI